MKAFTTSTLTSLVLLYLLGALSCHAAKTQLALSAGNSYMNFRFDVTQRCYSLDSCYAGKASYASWLALKESTRIAFYTANQCQGEHVTVSTAPRGSLKFAEVGFDKSVYSFMLLETGAYPISGFLDICHGNENTRLNTTNSTESGLLADGSDLMIATFDTSEDAGDN